MKRQKSAEVHRSHSVPASLRPNEEHSCLYFVKSDPSTLAGPKKRKTVNWFSTTKKSSPESRATIDVVKIQHEPKSGDFEIFTPKFEKQIQDLLHERTHSQNEMRSTQSSPTPKRGGQAKESRRASEPIRKSQTKPRDSSHSIPKNSSPEVRGRKSKRDSLLEGGEKTIPEKSPSRPKRQTHTSTGALTKKPEKNTGDQTRSLSHSPHGSKSLKKKSQTSPSLIKSQNPDSRGNQSLSASPTVATRKAELPPPFETKPTPKLQEAIIRSKSQFISKRDIERLDELNYRKKSKGKFYDTSSEESAESTSRSRNLMNQPTTEVLPANHITGAIQKRKPSIFMISSDAQSVRRSVLDRSNSERDLEDEKVLLEEMRLFFGRQDDRPNTSLCDEKSDLLDLDHPPESLFLDPMLDLNILPDSVFDPLLDVNEITTESNTSAVERDSSNSEQKGTSYVFHKQQGEVIPLQSVDFLYFFEPSLEPSWEISETEEKIKFKPHVRGTDDHVEQPKPTLFVLPEYLRDLRTDSNEFSTGSGSPIPQRKNLERENLIISKTRFGSRFGGISDYVKENKTVGFDSPSSTTRSKSLSSSENSCWSCGRAFINNPPKYCGTCGALISNAVIKSPNSFSDFYVWKLRPINRLSTCHVDPQSYQLPPLEDLLQQRDFYDVFYSFLKSEYAEESLDFYMAVERLHQIESHEVRGFILEINATFLVNRRAGQLISISWKCKEEISENIKSKLYTKFLFDNAQSEILKLMRVSAFSQFRVTPFYLEYLGRVNLISESTKKKALQTLNK